MPGKKSVLIVEDEQALSKVLQAKLENLGFTVSVASDGKTAVKLFDEKGPNIVLLDIMIPEMDGFAVLKEIREVKKSDVPVFMLSNLGQEEDKKRAKESGAQEYFVKADTPISDIALKVKEVLK